MYYMLKLEDEISTIFLWLGVWGIKENIFTISIINENKIYIYVLLILIGIYIKI